MKITIVWSMWHDEPDLAAQMLARGKQPVTSATITLDTPPCFVPDDKALLEKVFEETNLYTGTLFWGPLEKVLPANRTHTALSVGDYVVLDGRSYRCDSVGWSRVDERPADTNAPAVTS